MTSSPQTPDYDKTDHDLLTWVWHYEKTHHVPGCTLTDLSYCLDCHTDVYNVSQTLRARGITEWPPDWTPSFT